MSFDLNNFFSNPILTSVIVAFFLVRALEVHLHKNNYGFLKYLGAEELIPQTMQYYYKALLILVPLALGERIVLKSDGLEQLSLVSLGVFCFGMILKLWSIKSLGTLWTMSCMAYRGQKEIKTGPYRFLSHPEYLGRLCEGTGLLLLIGGYVSLAIFLFINFRVLRKIIATESRQIIELRATKTSP